MSRIEASVWRRGWGGPARANGTHPDPGSQMQLYEGPKSPPEPPPTLRQDRRRRRRPQAATNDVVAVAEVTRAPKPTPRTQPSPLLAPLVHPFRAIARRHHRGRRQPTVRTYLIVDDPDSVAENIISIQDNSKELHNKMTGQNMARLEDASVQYLSNVSGSMKKFIRLESDESLQSVVSLLDQKPGLLSRLLPTSFEKEARQIASLQLRQIADDKRAMLAIYTEVQMEIARQEGDMLVASRGLETGAMLAAFATQKFLELQETIAVSQTRFMNSYAPRKAEILAFKEDHPELYERAMKAQLHQLDTYFDTTEGLLDDFKAALAKRVDRHRTAPQERGGRS